VFPFHQLLQEVAVGGGLLPCRKPYIAEHLACLDQLTFKEGAPFSFMRCIAAVTQSPLSPMPYFGTVDADEIKLWIRCNAPRWMRETLARYPQWVQQEIYADPDRALRELDNNPRWINEELRARGVFGDFFV